MATMLSIKQTTSRVLFMIHTSFVIIAASEAIKNFIFELPNDRDYIVGGEISPPTLFFGCLNQDFC